MELARVSWLGRSAEPCDWLIFTGKLSLAVLFVSFAVLALSVSTSCTSELVSPLGKGMDGSDDSGTLRLGEADPLRVSWDVVRFSPADAGAFQGFTSEQRMK